MDTERDQLVARLNHLCETFPLYPVTCCDTEGLTINQIKALIRHEEGHHAAVARRRWPDAVDTAINSNL